MEENKNIEEQDLTLVIMAAGMGSRFGGLKQIEPIGPSGEFILDYSVYDAIKAGFNKVVFIIKRENYELFKETVGNRIAGKIQVDYVFQNMNNIPDFVDVPEGRERPWGTGHAIYSITKEVRGNFAVINADDLYGRDAFWTMREFFKSNPKENEYQLVGYQAKNVLSESGKVKRGVCEVKDGALVKLVECEIGRVGNVIMAEPLDGSPAFEIEDDRAISMNMFAFNSTLLRFIETDIERFFKENLDKLDTCEYLLPDIVCDLIKIRRVLVRVNPTTAKWMGMTFKEEKEILVNEINALIASGIYPEDLWE